MYEILTHYSGPYLKKIPLWILPWNALVPHPSTKTGVSLSSTFTGDASSPYLSYCAITVFIILHRHYLFSCPTLPVYLDRSSTSLGIRQTNTDWLESGGGGWCWAIFTEHLHQLYNVSRRGAVACPLLYAPQYQALLSRPSTPVAPRSSRFHAEKLVGLNL